MHLAQQQVQDSGSGEHRVLNEQRRRRYSERMCIDWVTGRNSGTGTVGRCEAVMSSDRQCRPAGLAAHWQSRIRYQLDRHRAGRLTVCERTRKERKSKYRLRGFRDGESSSAVLLVSLGLHKHELGHQRRITLICNDRRRHFSDRLKHSPVP